MGGKIDTAIQHERKISRRLEDEVQVVVNGSQEFAIEATALIKESVDKYFKRNSIGPRFFVRSKLKLVSETIRNTLRSNSHIDFMIFI